jgi:hypothetical protein
MKHPAGFCALALAVFLSSCGRKDDPALTKADPKAIEQVFSNSPALRQEVEQATAAIRQNNPVASLEYLSHLQSLSELTPDQRREAGRAMMATLKQVQAAAKAGDQRAQQAMDRYRRSK